MVASTLPPEIRVIAERIAEAYAPQRIILFGSWAEGQARVDSDVDLLVVKDTDERPLDRVRRVRRAFRGVPRRPGVDVIVLTPREVQDALEDGHSLVTRAVARGVVLYGA